VGRGKEIIARSTNAPFAIGAKSAQRHGTPPPRRAPVDPARRVSAVVFRIARWRAPGPWRQINDADIRSVASKIRTITTFIVLYRRLSAFADAFGGGA
jgi:hypothetical protein